jgi:hypothetical protein
MGVVHLHHAVYKLWAPWCGVSKVINTEPEKIGVVEWLTVRRHSRILYVPLRPEDVQLYDIRLGDQLKVEIHAIKKGLRDRDSGNGET